MVVLGVVGPPRSGKRKLAEALCAEHGFRLLFLGMPSEQRLNISSSSPSSSLVRSPRSQRGRQEKEGIYIRKLQPPINDYDVPPEEISNNLFATMGTLPHEAGGNKGHCDGGKNRTKGEDVCNASDSNSQLNLPKRRTDDSACQIVTFEGNVDALVDYGGWIRSTILRSSFRLLSCIRFALLGDFWICRSPHCLRKLPYLSAECPGGGHLQKLYQTP
eukprot:XP_028338688.1 uncharacterized protein LOC114484712 [Physeter catodon]